LHRGEHSAQRRGEVGRKDQGGDGVTGCLKGTSRQACPGGGGVTTGQGDGGGLTWKAHQVTLGPWHHASNGFQRCVNTPSCCTNRWWCKHSTSISAHVHNHTTPKCACQQDHTHRDLPPPAAVPPPQPHRPPRSPDDDHLAPELLCVLRQGINHVLLTVKAQRLQDTQPHMDTWLSCPYQHHCWTTSYGQIVGSLLRHA
jgi:hypothetical protein